MILRQNCTRRFFQSIVVFVAAVLFLVFILQKYSSTERSMDLSSHQAIGSLKQVRPCGPERSCPKDHFSFYIRSGAANVVGPKICIQNKVVLGVELKNSGVGINVVVLNGKTEEVIKMDHFDMYDGEVEPFIKLLESIEEDAVVLMASFDEPSSKLSKDARNLIAKLGSSSVHSLGFRDSWVFVGSKGGKKRNFEKHLKNDRAKNKYEGWPELLYLDGCIPKRQE